MTPERVGSHLAQVPRRIRVLGRQRQRVAAFRWTPCHPPNVAMPLIGHAHYQFCAAGGRSAADRKVRQRTDRPAQPMSASAHPSPSGVRRDTRPG
jgi:hypothetical protein